MYHFKISIKYRIVSIYACAVIVALVNTLFGSNRVVSYNLLMFQILLFIYLFFKKRYIDYLGFYILFCGLSMEYDKLVGNTVFYGFKNTRILGINLGILALIPLFLVSLKYILAPKGKEFSRFYKFIMFLQASAIIMGLLMIIFNDNGVQSFSNVIGLFVDNLYTMCVQQILIVVIFVMLVIQYNNIEPLEEFFLALLFGVVLSLFFSRVFGSTGYYGGVDTLMVSNNARWLPMMLLLPIYSKYKRNLFIWIFGLLGAALVLIYNATGKMVIIYALIPFIHIALNIKSKQYKSAFVILLVLPIIMLGIYTGAQRLSNTSILFNAKLNQALSLLDYFTGKIATDDVSSSPRTRLYETGNIILEYLNKPWLLPLGKGFLGTVRNYTNMPYHSGAYSKVQWQTGLFFRMHESINKLMLSNGIVGIVFLITTIINGIKRIAKTPWGAIGIYWLLICYGHSITMTAFGLPCLIYSIIQADRIEENYGELNNENTSY